MNRLQLVEQLTRAFSPLLAKTPARAAAEEAWARYCELCDTWAKYPARDHPSKMPASLCDEDKKAVAWALCLRYSHLSKVRLCWLPVKGKFAKPKAKTVRDRVQEEHWHELDPTFTTTKLALSIVLESQGARFQPLASSPEGPGEVALRGVAEAILDVLVFARHLTEAYEDARARVECGSRPHASDMPSFRRPRAAALKRRHAQIDAAYQDVRARMGGPDWHKHADWTKLGPEALNDAIILEPTPWADLAEEIERAYRNGLIDIEKAQNAVIDAAAWLDVGEPRPLSRPSVTIGSALSVLLGIISPARLGDDGMGLLRGEFLPLPSEWAKALSELANLRVQVIAAVKVHAPAHQVEPGPQAVPVQAPTAAVVVQVTQKGSANTRALELLKKDIGFAQQPARVWQKALGLASEGAVRHLAAWKNRGKLTAPRRAKGGPPVDEIPAGDKSLKALIQEQREADLNDERGRDRRGGV